MKKIAFNFLACLLILLIPCIVGEVATRLLLGKRLLFDVMEQDGFYRFKPNQKGWYLHNLRAPARINNIGARGADVDLNLLPSTSKFVFFGDSFTFGYALQDSETISHYFMQVAGLNSSAVLNFGNSAFGVYHMIRAYDHYQNLVQKDDTVILIMIEDDFYRPIADYHRTDLKDFLWKVRSHSSFLAWGITAVQQVAGENLAGWLLKLKRDERATHAKIAYANKKDIFREDGEMLLHFHQRLLKKGEKLVLVFYEYEQSPYSSEAKKFCKENNLTCVTNVYEWLKPLQQRGESIVCKYDLHHPSALANQALGKELHDFLVQK